jgi:hypothetical protein
MSYRRSHRWLHRLALGLALASVVFAGRASVATAKPDEGTGGGSRYVSAGGWSGPVDMESGIPLSAGIPQGDEQFIDPRGVQVIPYLSHGILTEADALAANGTYGDSRELPEPFVAGTTDFPRVPDSANVAAPPEPTNDGNWRFAWTDALPLGIGLAALALVFGLAVSRLRRPRVAGL